MEIQKDAFVALEYKLTLENGTLVEQTSADDPLCFVFGIGRMMPGLEDGIKGMKAGESAKIEVEPENAYGISDPERIQEISQSQFPENVEIKVGNHVQAMTSQGPIVFTIKEVKDGTVTCDFNHPLAGERLVFEVQIREVRPSTEDDIAAMDGCGCGDENCCD